MWVRSLVPSVSVSAHVVFSNSSSFNSSVQGRILYWGSSCCICRTDTIQGAFESWSAEVYASQPLLTFWSTLVDSRAGWRAPKEVKNSRFGSTELRRSHARRSGAHRGARPIQNSKSVVPLDAKRTLNETIWSKTGEDRCYRNLIEKTNLGENSCVKTVRKIA